MYARPRTEMLDEIAARRIAYGLAEDNGCSFNEAVATEHERLWSIQFRSGPGGDLAVATVSVLKSVQHATFSAIAGPE